jgi:hypothetical protein
MAPPSTLTTVLVKKHGTSNFGRNVSTLLKRAEKRLSPLPVSAILKVLVLFVPSGPAKLNLPRVNSHLNHPSEALRENFWSEFENANVESAVGFAAVSEIGL